MSHCGCGNAFGPNLGDRWRVRIYVANTNGSKDIHDVMECKQCADPPSSPGYCEAQEDVSCPAQREVVIERAGDHATAQKFYQAAQNVHQYAAQTTSALVGVQQPSPGFDQGGAGLPPGGAPMPNATMPVNAAPAQGPAATGGFDPEAAMAEARRRKLIK